MKGKCFPWVEPNSLREVLTHIASASARSQWNASVVSAGKSEEGRDIWHLLLSPRYNTQTRPLAQRLLLVGNQHGDETVGRRLVADFARWLVNGTDDRVQLLANLSTHFHLLPSLNPDGFARCTRTNANGLDLNRNFPDRWSKSTGELQAETRVAMALVERNGPFSLVVDLHGGFEGVVYPYDAPQDGTAVEELSPADALFKHLANAYASRHPTMASVASSEGFTNGISNGARWYPVYGSLQDYIYAVAKSGNALTIELTLDKSPPDPGTSLLLPGASRFFDDNKESLAALALEANRGIIARIVGSAVRDGSLSAILESDSTTTFEETRVFAGPGSFTGFRMTLPPGKFQASLGPGECVSSTAYLPSCYLSSPKRLFVIGNGSTTVKDFLTEIDFPITCSTAACLLYPSRWLGVVVSTVLVFALFACAVASHCAAGCRRSSTTRTAVVERGKV